MQPVLDGPMASDPAAQLGGRAGVAGEVVMTGTRPLPADLPLPVHLDHRRQEWHWLTLETGTTAEARSHPRSAGAPGPGFAPTARPVSEAGRCPAPLPFTPGHHLVSSPNRSRGR